MNFREIFNSGRGYKFKNYDGTFGLEIETETESLGSYPSHFFHLAGEEKGLNKYDLDSKSWYAIEDHSLRNYGMEFPLKVPLSYYETLAALDEFKELTRTVNFIDCPPGASVHVHVNMLPERLITMANFIALWVMFETPLVEFCGVPRRSNLFALPVRVAEEGLKHYCTLMKLLSDKNDMAISNFNEESCKYSALNIATLHRLGTLEVRPMRGTTDIDIIKTWVSIIWNMLKFARTNGLTPYYILQEAKDDPTDLMNRVFGEYAPIVMNPHWKAQLERNLHYVYTLVDSVESWENFADYTPIKEKEPRAPRKKAASLTIDELLTPYAPEPGQPINPVYGGNGGPTLNTGYWLNTAPAFPVAQQVPDYTDEEISNMSEDEFTQYLSLLDGNNNDTEQAA